jgi:hypothetical protein
MIQEFINEVESGFGFIFEEDVKKYWKQAMGSEVEDAFQYQDILTGLRDHNLLK